MLAQSTRRVGDAAQAPTHMVGHSHPSVAQMITAMVIVREAVPCVALLRAAACTQDDRSTYNAVAALGPVAGRRGRFPMTSRELQKIRKAVRAEMADTEKEILSLRETSLAVAPTNAVGRLSRMDAINNKAISDTLLAAASQRMVELEQTLARLDDPSFGKCVICGGNIGINRLVAIPESNRCVTCAE
jgi:DnaK suppressor protein